MEVRLPSVSPAVVRRIALASVICFGLLVVTGGAVRLTGSGLGCPDWPSCYQHRLVAQLSFHPLVEDVNRFMSVLVTVVSALAFVLALLRRPRRRDLVWLAGGLVGGIVAQIVLGGLVVLFKLNPYLVAVHFLLTIVIVAVAVVFFHRAGLDDSAVAVELSAPLVGRDLVWLARVVVGVLGLLTVVGTMVSGAGPHAGAPSTPTQPISRVGIAFHDIAELHSDVALFLIGLTLATLFALHHSGAAAVVQQRARWMFELMVFQGAIGFTQYFAHDNPAVVEVHLAGVTALWIAAVGFYLSLHAHPATPRDAVPDLGAKTALSRAT
jgi:cytochrome c oxidase assembly protein subunit 15